METNTCDEQTTSKSSASQFQTTGHQWEISQHGPSLGGTRGGSWWWQWPNVCTHFHLSPKRGGAATELFRQDGTSVCLLWVSVFGRQMSECLMQCCGDPTGPIILCNLSAYGVASPPHLLGEGEPYVIEAQVMFDSFENVQIFPWTFTLESTSQCKGFLGSFFLSNVDWK